MILNKSLDFRPVFRYNSAMNKLPEHKRIQALTMLVEGSSMRSISRVVGISINTVTKLLVDAGAACERIHDERVRDVDAQRVQCDEIWSFCYAKAKNVGHAEAAPVGAGDVWTWTAIDSDSKLIISWLISPGRDSGYAIEVMDDLRSRLANRVQLTTDGHRAYLEAVEGAFGGDVDYAQLVKLYGVPENAEQRRYSPAYCMGSRKVERVGSPRAEDISTSHVERHNLTMRMSMRRFTRLTNAFSKKAQNHAYSVALYTVWFNFLRPHKSLDGRTPAQAAGLTKERYGWDWILKEMDSN